uniref:Protein NPG1 n=1 Tax=Tanacetum cinerariifolium TaxID=118510 RepID=A0A6L2JL52_TANCI|nr:protein NPG1 [Tanacetum cinerariifolium]
MNQNQIGRTVFDIDEESDAFFFQKAIEYHEWLLQQEAQPRLTHTPIFRDREDVERRLRADYFDDHCRIQSTADLFIMMNKQYIDVTGGSMLCGQRPLALIVSAQQRFSKAKVVTGAVARAETVKWDDGLLLRLKTKLGMRLLE